ncbi:Uncharacterized protein OBRU01_04888 [Operophtera brumata]|uniref:Uncharacterized protein n=1 Tax=Operophtera brumata TaxID=104452 RepID=A0A0L7LNB3_OPEBR|nr:Uncharacterized protein OBRU01_04888 [Operophtera brumata]
MNVALSKIRNEHAKVHQNLSQGEYYKKYEYDEVPVKDCSTESSSFLTPKNKGSLTNSDLEKLENRIFKNVSEELQTEDSRLTILESNIKFFKTTVERIFDSFYANMKDFEYYKSRFNDIIARSRDGSLDDMENFIADMFEHIMSSETSACNITSEQKVDEAASSANTDKADLNKSTSAFEAYKNENYLTDSTDEDTSAKETSSKVQEILSIILLGGNPCVQIKMNDQNQISEKDIRGAREKFINCVASADDIKMAAKKMELERHVTRQDHNGPDRDIPVRVSYARQNIYLNEDFAHQDDGDNSKSLISKICMLCKKFRKNYFS